MAEHKRVNDAKKGDEDQRQRTKRQDSKPLFDQSLAWDGGLFSLTETPFHPQINEHSAILSRTPFSAQRREFIMRLHQTYGNRYVQRLIESMDVQGKLNISAPNDIYEQEADRIAKTVTRAANTQVQRQPVEEEEEEVMPKLATELQRQPVEEEEEEVMPKLAAGLQRQPMEEEEEELQMQSAVGELEVANREEEEIQTESYDSDGVKSTTQQIGSRESIGQKTPPTMDKDEKISLVAATAPISRDLTAKDMVNASGLTKINLSDVKIKGTIYEDNGEYKITVTKASMKIHWGIEDPPSYHVPDPQDDGNITQANYQTVIDTLKDYETRQYAGNWHHPDATEAHEKNHVQWYKDQIIATWPPIETEINEHVLGAAPAKKSKGRFWEGVKGIFGASKAQKAMKAYLRQKESDWFNAFGVAPEPPAYAAGQAVLDGIIEDIKTYARQKGWMA